MHKVHYIRLMESGMVEEEIMELNNVLEFKGINHDKHNTYHTESKISKFSKLSGEPILTVDWTHTEWVIVETDIKVRVKTNIGLTVPGMHNIFIFLRGLCVNEPQQTTIKNISKVSYNQTYLKEVDITVEFNFGLEPKHYNLKSDVECETTEVQATMRIIENKMEIYLKWMRTDYENEDSLPWIEETYEYKIDV